jgi:hypothetical protein
VAIISKSEPSNHIRELTADKLMAVSGGWGWVDTWPDVSAPTGRDVWNAFVTAAGVPQAQMS